MIVALGDSDAGIGPITHNPNKEPLSTTVYKVPSNLEELRGMKRKEVSIL